MRPSAAAVLFAALGATALLAHHWAAIAAISVALLLACIAAGGGRRRVLYLTGAGVTALSVFLITPFVETIGSHPLWTGPTVPVVGTLDVTREELTHGAVAALRLLAVSLAFAAYALLVDHDGLLRSVRAGRRSALGVVLATRLVPTLERDAGGMVEALRGRGVEVAGVRGHARLLSPLLAGSLERAYNLAESMEARGYGRPGGTRALRGRWGTRDWLALAAAAALVSGGALWL